MSLADLEPVGDGDADAPPVLYLLFCEILAQFRYLVARDEIFEEVDAPAFRNRRQDLHLDGTKRIASLADVVHGVLITG